MANMCVCIMRRSRIRRCLCIGYQLQRAVTPLAGQTEIIIWFWPSNNAGKWQHASTSTEQLLLVSDLYNIFQFYAICICITINTKSIVVYLWALAKGWCHGVDGTPKILAGVDVCIWNHQSSLGEMKTSWLANPYFYDSINIQYKNYG